MDTSDTKHMQDGKLSIEAPDQKSICEGDTQDVLIHGELPLSLRDLSPEELKACEKGLLRKLDARLMPTMILIYIMNYLDRSVKLDTQIPSPSLKLDLMTDVGMLLHLPA